MNNKKPIIPTNFIVPIGIIAFITGLNILSYIILHKFPTMGDFFALVLYVLIVALGYSTHVKEVNDFKASEDINIKIFSLLTMVTILAKSAYEIGSYLTEMHTNNLGAWQFWSTIQYDEFSYTFTYKLVNILPIVILVILSLLIIYGVFFKYGLPKIATCIILAIVLAMAVFILLNVNTYQQVYINFNVTNFVILLAVAILLFDDMIGYTAAIIASLIVITIVFVTAYQHLIIVKYAYFPMKFSFITFYVSVLVSGVTWIIYSIMNIVFKNSY